MPAWRAAAALLLAAASLGGSTALDIGDDLGLAGVAVDGRRRQLTAGAMDELNRLLADLVFNIPDQDFVIPTPAGSIDPDIKTHLRGLSCNKLGMGGLTLRARKPSEQEVTLDITISDITIQCACDWSYEWVWDGRGTATAHATAANHNRLTTSITFHSTNYGHALPSLPPTIPACSTSVHFQPMKFDGKNVGGDVIQLFDGTVQKQIEKALNTKACSALGDLVPNLLASVLASLNTEIEPWMRFMDLPPARDDAMRAERQLDPSAVSVEDPLIQLPQNWIMQLFLMAADKLNSPTHPTCRPDWQGKRRCTGPLVVNDVIDFITDQSGSIEIDDFFGLFGWNSTISSGDDTFSETVKIQSLKLAGLDSFTRFDILQLLGNYTIMNGLVMEYLGVEVTADITLTPNQHAGGSVVAHRGAVTEHVVLHTGIANASVELAGMIAVREAVATIQLGDMIRHPLGCVFSDVFSANLTYVNVTVGGVTHPIFQGFISAGVDHLFNGIADAAFLMYEEVAEKMLPGIMQTSLRQGINNITTRYLADPANIECPARVHAKSLVFMDFTSTDLTVGLAWLLNQAIGVANANKAIGSVTKAASGTDGLFEEPGYLVDSTTVMKDGKDVCLTCSCVGRIVMKAANLSISGLDTITEMSLLQPAAPNTLHNDLRIGESPPVGLSIDLFLSIHGTAINIDDHFTVSVDLKGVHFLLDILLMVDQEKFWDIEMGELAEYTAYLSTLAAARPEKLGLSFERVGLGINCKHCSSSLLRQMASNLKQEGNIAQLTVAVNSMLANLGNHFTKDPKVQQHYEMMLSDYSEVATQMANNKSGCLDLAGPTCKLLASTMACQTNPVYMREHCKLSCGVCTLPAPDALPIPPSIFGAVATVVVLACLIGVGFCCAPFCSKKTVKLNKRAVVRSSSSSSSNSNSAEPSLSPTKSGLLDAPLVEVNMPAPTPDIHLHKGSIFRSHHVPLSVRLFVPLWLCCNVALFVTGHLTIGATVDLHAQLAGDSVEVNRVVEFSLGRSLQDMYHAGAIALFYFIGLFSGVWPYTKILVMLYCWVMPMNAENRGSVLEKMDYAGVWSLIDLYVLVMCLLAFNLHVQSPESLSFVPVNFYVFDLMVTPVWGLYGFMLGVISSIILNYCCLHAHRTAVRGATIELNARTADPNAPVPAESWIDAGTTDVIGQRAALVSQTEALSQHVFEGRGLYYRFSFNKNGQRGVMAGLALAGFLTLLGASVPSFEFKVHGIAGLLVDLGVPGSSLNRYGLISSAVKITAQAPSRYGGDAGLFSIALVYLMFGLLVPIAVLCVVAVQWSRPLTLRAQKQLFVLNEALCAWSALEVFMLSIAVATVEIGQVSGFIVGNMCRGLGPWLGDLVTYGLLDTSDDTCFLIEAEVCWGMYLLLLGSLVSSVTCRLVTKLTHEAIVDRERRILGANVGEGVEGSGKAPKAGLSEQCMQCSLLGLGFIHIWDKSWDHEYANENGLDTSGLAEAGTAAVRGGAKWFASLMDGGDGGGGGTGSSSSPALIPTISTQSENGTAASSGGGTESLRPGWVEAVNPSDGRRFHWSVVTGETVWVDEPSPQSPQSPPLRPAAGLMQSRPASPDVAASPRQSMSLPGAELARQAVELDNAGDVLRASAAYRAAADWMETQQDVRFMSKASEYRQRSAELSAVRHSGME
eukprot:COSAG06_NODE_801_length_12195_cov_106.299934_6_plen_1670_part_00